MRNGWLKLKNAKSVKKAAEDVEREIEQLAKERAGLVAKYFHPIKFIMAVFILEQQLSWLKIKRV